MSTIPETGCEYLETVSEENLEFIVDLLMQGINEKVDDEERRSLMIDVIVYHLIRRFPESTCDELQARFAINFKQTMIYQMAWKKGFALGIQQTLERKFSVGELPLALTESLQSLSSEQLENLREALFDFETPTDFEAWLQT